jgi:hypothetical protein
MTGCDECVFGRCRDGRRFCSKQCADSFRAYVQRTNRWERREAALAAGDYTTAARLDGAGVSADSRQIRRKLARWENRKLARASR